MVCLDTSVIIDILRGNEVVESIEKQFDETSETVTVAAPTVMELIKGARLSNKPESEKLKVTEFLSSLTTLDLNKDSAMLAGEIDAELKVSGEPIGVQDVMIAAIAIKNREALITKNTKHFERIKDLKTQTY